MIDPGANPDLRAARLAGQQDSVLSEADLRRAGLQRDAVRRRVAKGLLDRVHVGAYALPADLTPRGRMRAALVSCGEPVWLGARSACALWGFIDEWHGPVDVLLHGRHLQREGINVWTTRWLPEEHRAMRHGLPVTSPARSLLDLGPLVDPGLHEHAVAAALRKRWATEADLRALARTRRRGAPALGAHLDRLGGAQFSRSEAERIALRLCREARLPAPALNEEVHGAERDLVWRDAHVVGEFDGDAFHWSPASKRADGARDAHLELRGWRSVRLTWHELTEEPLVVVARIATALAEGRRA